MRAFTKVAALLAAATGGGVVPAAAQAAGILPYDKPEQVEAGGVLYADNCASCHGGDLQGEPDWQMRDSEGYLPAPPLDGSGHAWHHPDEQLLEVVREGVEAIAGGGYKSRMEGFGSVLSDAEMRQVLAYVKSRWPAEVVARHNQINSQGHAHN
ncbi:c-type cytochrome [Leisingera sp. JC1]|uniref:c-type cytochrome n=1 Tax=Leisingera sp. JC1 TaxID=1855282 RepID=UPI000802B644|nr:cytochrome c [Leisingera sp. JC1]OBY27806.1 cytochrome C [Leisingera sp. JC1]